MSYRILLVDCDPTAGADAEQALVGAGYRVAPVATFEEATRQISLDCPDLLITAIRLGAFNGLHLMIRSRADHPDLPVVIVGDSHDFTSDIGRYGGRFVAKPIDRAALLQAVSGLLAARTPHDPTGVRVWPRKAAEHPATVLEAPARVVELSYGGHRIEMSTSPNEISAPLDIGLPTLGLSVTAVTRWLKPSHDRAAWWCGAEIAPSGADATRKWRWIVDSLN